jgi:hypothetical protein
MTHLIAHADNAPHVHVGQYALYLISIVAAALGATVVAWKLRARGHRNPAPRKEAR